MHVTIRATGPIVLLLSLLQHSARAQMSTLPSWADSFAVIAPGPQYRRSGLWTTFAGRHYRELWTTPLRVPVLSLQRYAGGLTPVRAHTGHQTKSLRFSGADGRTYQFRSVDKDPTALLAPELQGSVIAGALHDGVSASFPTAPLVANGLLRAAGVLTQPQILILMPDDPALGDFRTEFGGKLGLLEEREADNREHVGGPHRVISPERLFERIDASPDDRVDARAFLRARLMDMFMGDRDRHRDQFRWAVFRKTPPRLWQPVSRDHDEAFVNLDGFALDIVRLYFLPMPTFETRYPPQTRLNWHSREIDPRFLADLDRSAWDSIATALQAELTDAAIDSAVRLMPAELHAVAGERLARVLRARRDGLRTEALNYYAYLARVVEVRASDAPEVAEITLVDPEHLDVTVRARDAAEPFFHRRFSQRETSEVRLMMWGGDDLVIVGGSAAPHIRVRVVGGAGDDVFVDSTSAGGVRYYDDRGHNALEAGRRVNINTKHYDEWVGSDTNRYPPREAGTWWRPIPWVVVDGDLGLFLGAGIARTVYGFRRSPYASEIRARIGYATAPSTFSADLDADLHPENASHFWRLHLGASGTAVLRFYGLGNDTPNLGDSDFYRVNQEQYEVEPALVVPIGPGLKVSAGPLLRWSSTDDNSGRFIAPLRDTLLGGSDFGQMGGRLQLELDTRDRRGNPLRGIYLTAAGELYPSVWDVPGTYGSGEAEADAFVSAKMPGTPTLALRAGGRRVWGSFPFFESAFLGGSKLAGYRSNRFAGDASLYGGAQLRLTAGRAFLALPGIWGVFGNVDAGRVYLDGESPGGWHSGGGGGVWFAFLDRDNTISLGIAASKEETLVRAGGSFGF